MKLRVILLGMVAIGSALGAYFCWYQSPPRPAVHPVVTPVTLPSIPSARPVPRAVTNQATFVPDPNVTVKPKMFRSRRYPPVTPEEKAMWSWYLWAKAKDPSMDWKSPIEFYGIVVDQDNNALPDADVNWITTNMQGNGRGTTISGPDGRFFIGNTLGKVMSVSVRKNGYRSVENVQGFEFSDFTRDNFYVSDADHPVTFHLRRRPTPEPYYGWSGLSDNIMSPTSPLSIKGTTGEISPGEASNGMWIQFVPGPQNQWNHQQYNIVVGTSGGNGVILQAPNGDPVAPSIGYQNPLNTNMILDSQGSRSLNVNTFFKDGTGNYGATRLTIQVVDNAISIRYDIKYNPNGGNVLMFDRKVQINNPDSIHSSNH
jgi:hypothetical protein